MTDTPVHDQLARARHDMAWMACDHWWGRGRVSKTTRRATITRRKCFRCGATSVEHKPRGRRWAQ